MGKAKAYRRPNENKGQDQGDIQSESYSRGIMASKTIKGASKTSGFELTSGRAQYKTSRLNAKAVRVEVKDVSRLKNKKPDTDFDQIELNDKITLLSNLMRRGFADVSKDVSGVEKNFISQFADIDSQKVEVDKLVKLKLGMK